MRDPRRPVQTSSDGIIPPLDLSIPATIARLKKEATMEREIFGHLSKRSDQLEEKANEAQAKEEELDREANLLKGEIANLDQTQIPDLLTDINNAHDHLSHLEQEHKESTYHQEMCRHQARTQRINELQFRKQVLEHSQLSNDLRSESGAKRWFGLQNHRMGRHKRGHELDDKAMQLIQQSEQKEQESQAALGQAVLCEREVERLINHAMARAIYRNELRREQTQVKNRIESLTQAWEAAKLRLKQLKTQEAVLRNEEWAYGDHAIELFSLAQRTMEQATEHSEAADALDQRIQNMEN